MSWRRSWRPACLTEVMWREGVAVGGWNCCRGGFRDCLVGQACDDLWLLLVIFGVVFLVGFVISVAGSSLAVFSSLLT